VSVSDDGRGFSVGTGLAADGHFGLVGMRERADEIGGSLDIRSTPGKGTTVVIEVPFR
jgi:signal transduction histidine kinase